MNAIITPLIYTFPMTLPSSLVNSWTLTEMICDLSLLLDNHNYLVANIIFLFSHVQKRQMISLASYLHKADLYPYRAFEFYLGVQYYPGYAAVKIRPCLQRSNLRVSLATNRYEAATAESLEAIANCALGRRKVIHLPGQIYY